MTPLPFTRRMWAGGALRTLMPLRIGDMVSRPATIARKKDGAGELRFVTPEHDHAAVGKLAIVGGGFADP